MDTHTNMSDKTCKYLGKITPPGSDEQGLLRHNHGAPCCFLRRLVQFSEDTRHPKIVQGNQKRGKKVR